MFERLVHADWSTHHEKKWMAIAERTPEGWQVAAPRPVPSGPELMDHWLFNGPTVLAGFDFPIGVPAAFGRKTGFGDFREALAEFGLGEWNPFFYVAERLGEISLRRPFYPKAYGGGPKQADLLRALGIETMDELRRECERKTSSRRAACSLFWTLGGNQVGKAAIDGWKSVIQPALRRGARLWPFDGRLDELSQLSGCVLCETYPQEGYAHVGAKLRQGGGKRIQKDRQDAGASMICWAEKYGVRLADEARTKLREGFGSSESGEDPFDACVGLFSMIEVVDHRRPEGEAPDGDATTWEGWILGQQPAGRVSAE
jgi:hypothetical protein